MMLSHRVKVRMNNPPINDHSVWPTLTLWNTLVESATAYVRCWLAINDLWQAIDLRVCHRDRADGGGSEQANDLRGQSSPDMMNDLPACKNVSTISLDLPFELFIFAYMSTFVIDFPFGSTRGYIFESSETEFSSGFLDYLFTSVKRQKRSFAIVEYNAKCPEKPRQHHSSDSIEEGNKRQSRTND